MAQEIKENKKELHVKPTLKYQRDKDREMVKGIFRYHEVPGGAMEFVYKAYKGDEVEKYLLIDGVETEIPLGVAKHLNKNGWYPEYGYVSKDSIIGDAYTGVIPTGSMKPSPNQMMKVARKVRRFSFQSLEFMDIDDLPNSAQSIVTVEKV